MGLTLATRDPAAPFVTYYDEASGERTELSTTSLLNWQAKTANLLRDGYGCSSDSVVGVALPLHWLVPVFVGAVSALGATLAFPSAGGGSELSSVSFPVPVDVAVVGPDSVSNPPDADDILACSLRPMAQGFAQALPTGLDDFTAEVRVYGDFFAGLPSAIGAPALQIGERSWGRTEAQEKLHEAVRRWQFAANDRVLFAADRPSATASLAASVALATVGASGVIVVGADSERLSVIAAQERVTRTFDESDTSLEPGGLEH